MLVGGRIPCLARSSHGCQRAATMVDNDMLRAPPGVFLPPSAWAWIDPGVFALIGAGAFMGGVTRLTVALAVIMMEVRAISCAATEMAHPSLPPL